MQLLGPWTDSGAISASAGGKARGLHILHNSGFAVPEWAVLGTDVFDAFATGAGLDERIAEFAAADTPEAAAAAGAALRSAIESADLPADVAELIGDGYRRLGGGAVAVRSSVAAEDGPAHSYAGQFDSFLNVDGEDAVRRRVRACWASAFSQRSIEYAFAHDQPRVAAVAVVLQRLVPARVSGVMFTADPASGSPDELVISAVYGLGEGLVSGAVDADSVVVDRAGNVLDTVIGDKDRAFLPSDLGGSASSEVDVERRARLALSEDEIAALAELGRKLEAELGAPQDIEWAIDDDGIWFLQARPITTALAPAADRAVAAAALIRGAGEAVPDGETRIWDNSNIIESFSGLTSPLTYTTAADIYGRVYRGYAESLKVPAEQLRQTDEWTPVLLGYFHGRVYYNLLHWYRMVGIAPGYPLNRKVLEAALGVDEPLPDEVAKTLRPYTFGSTAERIRSRTVTTVTYARRLFGIDAMVEQFLTEFYRVYDEYEALDYPTLTGEQAYAAYRKVDADLVRRWGPLMVLDAILLTCTGAMFLLTKLFLPKAPEWFLYAVVGPGADVESAEPARALTAMAETVHADPELTALINSTEPQQVYRQLHTSETYAGFRAEVDAYIDRYGYRSLDELKLETPDLREDPASLFVMLRSALGRVGQAGQQPDRAAEADAYLDAHLTGVRRRIYERLRAKVSRCAAHRERLRFCRTRAFGMVKRMIRVMGRDLAARGIIDEFSDVFYLTVQELRGSYEGADTRTYRDLVTARKVQRAKDAELVAPARFSTIGSTFGRAELASQGWVPVTDTPPATPGTVLAGTPSSSGVVEGGAVVVDEPRDVAGGILIAYRTDPGWVAALPSASALVIERGSPLTHVAIVARELGVPTVVQVKDITKRIRTGMRIRVDGTTGTVTVLSGAESGDE
ncbi:phosphoenolpyruvate synthase [Nocardia cyriacigeorgica]|uniref:Phosphoenolpyruvate synthase n=1 Tax=Nocardia cyriacigeorgica TaxID=135487 RepID=A0A4U8W983_9NOCA|nr:phosphoenolpyruvate synthase [Nocardia cyriacigeorgica]MBF6344503.1 phosphoenolpyruvate synthase [Nocardia cyriacigeorgica]VFB01916.1 Phosphoenolpyruvate synthase [Nocardia cyriacigeorgica]